MPPERGVVPRFCNRCGGVLAIKRVKRPGRDDERLFDKRVGRREKQKSPGSKIRKERGGEKSYFPATRKSF